MSNAVMSIKEAAEYLGICEATVRELVRTAVTESPLKDALLIEKENAFYLPAGLDRTDELIGCINELTLNLPDPPKPVRIEYGAAVAVIIER